jgi:hypothetical protein
MNEHTESGIFRQGIGLLCIVGGLSALAGLYFIDVPAGNKEPLLLAIGIILGWGGSVVNSEYGATTTGGRLPRRLSARWSGNSWQAKFRHRLKS